MIFSLLEQNTQNLQVKGGKKFSFFAFLFLAATLLVGANHTQGGSSRAITHTQPYPVSHTGSSCSQKPHPLGCGEHLYNNHNTVLLVKACYMYSLF